MFLPGLFFKYKGILFKFFVLPKKTSTPYVVTLLILGMPFPMGPYQCWAITWFGKLILVSKNQIKIESNF